METLSGTQVIAGGLLAQAAGSVLLAALLLVFHRIYRHRYLADWSRSFAALCLHHLTTSASLSLLSTTEVTDPSRILLSTVSLLAGYWQVAWLLFGTEELTGGREVTRSLRRNALIALALLAVVSVVGSLVLPSTWRYVVRVGLRSLFSGLALAISGALLLRRRRSGRLGRLAVAGGFLLYGLEQLHYFALTLARLAGAAYPVSPVYLGFFDLLIQLILGLALVIWFLELERLRALTATEHLEHLSRHDALTGLANRNLLLERLDSALERAGRYGGRIAVVRFNLDRFRRINNVVGPREADRLLRAVADRLGGSVRASDTLARLIGDEFVLLLPDAGGEEEVARRTGELLDVLRRPFSHAGRDMTITASAGIARFPEDGSEAEELLQKTNLALVQAKATGRDHFHLYRPALGLAHDDRTALEGDLRTALGKGQFLLHYQPVLAAGSRRIQGVEALLRWNHPHLGRLDPHRFLWLIEDGGLAQTVDLWAIESACRQAADWQGSGARGLRLAVNISAHLLQRPDLATRIDEILRATGLPSRSLELEITETLAVRDADVTLEVLAALKRLGVRLAIDDFGTGYSSLSYLMKFPLDTLKVDRSFIQALSTDSDGAQIAAAVISLAHSLDLEVVAEGVEDLRQWEIVHEQGCDRVQGYLFSPPLPADSCGELVLRRTPLQPMAERKEVEGRE